MLWYMNRCRVLRLQLHLSGQIDQFKIVYYEILDVPFYSCKTKFSKKKLDAKFIQKDLFAKVHWPSHTSEGHSYTRSLIFYTF